MIFAEFVTDEKAVLCQPVLHQFKFYRKEIPQTQIPISKLENTDFQKMLAIPDIEIKSENHLKPVEDLFNSLMNYFNMPTFTYEGKTYIPNTSIIDLKKMTIVTPSLEGGDKLILCGGYIRNLNKLSFNTKVVGDIESSLKGLPPTFIPYHILNTNYDYLLDILKYKLCAYLAYSVYSDFIDSHILVFQKNKYKYNIKGLEHIPLMNPYETNNINTIIKNSYGQPIEDLCHIYNELDRENPLTKIIYDMTYLYNENKVGELTDYYEKYYLNNLKHRAFTFSYYAYMLANLMEFRKILICCENNTYNLGGYDYIC